MVDSRWLEERVDDGQPDRSATADSVRTSCAGVPTELVYLDPL